MYERSTTILTILLYALSVTSGQTWQNDTCSDRDATEPCLKNRFKTCLKNRIKEFNSPVVSQCMQTCESFIGPNSGAILDCIQDNEVSKLDMKVKIAECVRLETIQPSAGFYPNFQQFQTVNVSELIQYEMDKNLIKNYAPLKLYEKCSKSCTKQVKVPKGVSKAAKLNKNAVLSQCYIQIYGRQLFPTKGPKHVAKLCSSKVVTDKYMLISSFAQCLQRANNNEPLPVVENDDSDDDDSTEDK